MPLSEHEQQMLAQLERALATEDPRFAHQMRGGAERTQRRRRLIIGLLGLVVGLSLVLVGVNTTMWVGVGGFAVMVAAVAYALAPVRTVPLHPDSGSGRGPARKGGGAGRPGFMDKLDERWEKRERGL